MVRHHWKGKESGIDSLILFSTCNLWQPEDLFLHEATQARDSLPSLKTTEDQDAIIQVTFLVLIVLRHLKKGKLKVFYQGCFGIWMRDRTSIRPSGSSNGARSSSIKTCWPQVGFECLGQCHWIVPRVFRKTFYNVFFWKLESWKLDVPVTGPCSSI